MMTTRPQGISAVAAAGPLTVQMPIEVRASRDTGGSLEVTWRTHADAIDRDYEIFLERLVRYLETVLVRIHQHPLDPPGTLIPAHCVAHVRAGWPTNAS
jgi:hypothetical protein